MVFGIPEVTTDTTALAADTAELAADATELTAELTMNKVGDVHAALEDNGYNFSSFPELYIEMRRVFFLMTDMVSTPYLLLLLLIITIIIMILFILHNVCI